jgi:transcriptional regulator with XRE-family HTH domain
MPDAKPGLPAATAAAKAGIKPGRAVEGIRALQSQLAEENPRYADAVALEDHAENFCRAVRDDLRDRRKELGLDQSEVAERLDLTQSAVSKIESGDGDIGLKTLFRYAHALGLVPVCTFVPDGSRMFADHTAAAAEAMQALHIELVKDTSDALARAVKGIARSFHADEDDARKGEIEQDRIEQD